MYEALAASANISPALMRLAMQQRACQPPSNRATLNQRLSVPNQLLIVP
jgi:hypothetical protein